MSGARGDGDKQVERKDDVLGCSDGAVNRHTEEMCVLNVKNESG